MTPRFLFVILLLLLALAACGDEVNAPAQGADNTATGHEGEAGAGEKGHDEGGIALTPEQIKAADIQLAQAGPAQIRTTLPLYGVIAPNAERVRDVAARYPGVIRSVAKKVGDPVAQGEPLAIVESNESLETYAVAAPLAGVVTARNANPGEQTGDKSLFTVADLSTVWVELSLFPRDVSKVRVGQDVRVLSTEAGLSADGKVVYVAPFGTAANQTLTARVLLNNATRRWAPGLYVTAEVGLSEVTVPLAVRNEAVQTLENKTVVFVQHEAGFEPRPVRPGRSDSAHTEVLDGLAAGETYVARNSFILKAEAGKGEAEHGH
ncbi:MAG: efflux RND transporter periplasmic adaptor subunit [Gammaproteobacteria bacterium]